MIWHEPAKVHWVEPNKGRPSDSERSQQTSCIRSLDTVRLSIAFVMEKLPADVRATATIHSCSAQLVFSQIEAAYTYQNKFKSAAVSLKGMSEQSKFDEKVY